MIIEHMAPRIDPMIDKGKIALIQYLKSIPLNEDETHATIAFDWDENDVHLLVATYSGREMKRVLARHESSDLKNLIKKVL